MSNFDTYSPATGGIPGTAPQIIVATTDDTLGVMTTAGYIEDLVALGMTKPFDVWFINYDVDGTENSGVFIVTDTSGGSLVAYPAAVGGALLSANNLSDVADVGTSRTNLGLGVLDSPVFAGVTLDNEGLHLLDTNATHDLIIKPGSNLTADRIFTLVTGDAARTLDISAANVTISAFMATLLDDAANLNALTTLGIKRGTTAAYAGGGTSNAFVAAGIVATDIVVASLLSATNNVSLTKVVPGAATLTVDFSADPGAATTVNWIAIPTV